MTIGARDDNRLRSDVMIVAPEGRLHHDTTVPDDFYESVRRLLEDGYLKIIVDFSGVTAIDATGVARLTRALTTTCRAGGSLKLLRVPPHVYDLLEIIRLHDTFEFFDQEKDAIESLIPRESN